METTSASYENSTELLPRCDQQSDNPWCGQFGILQVFEVIYLLLLCIGGSLGNLLVIVSIIFEKKVTEQGNIFIINLAVADFYITAVFVPSIIANVIESENALPMVTCRVFAYSIVITCCVSMTSLALIAFSRYWAVVRDSSYNRVFTQRRYLAMAFAAWFWSNLLALPTVTGWSGLMYDASMMNCAYDYLASKTYNIFLLGLGIFLPMSVIIFNYYAVFSHVRAGNNWSRSLNSTRFQMSRQEKKRLKREIRLLKTLAATVVAFVLCWAPFGLGILIAPTRIPDHVKKFLAWLAFSNSGVNFIIYGLMNRTYRRGYRNLLRFIFCSCKYDKTMQPNKIIAVMKDERPDDKTEVSGYDVEIKFS
ncbi:melatonin receptor type 1A-like [Clavelina lepadiformis]|uniref:melatonin receptor type 1A-like n=1 Tax=Clavelina lepadiformis TaxID=159417 RepID=UPI004040F123